MRYLSITMLYMILFACSQIVTQRDYPAIIKKHHLEQQYDKAKWELYKVNSIRINENSLDFVVILKGDEELRKFFIEKRRYQSQGKNLYNDRNKLNELFDKGKVTQFANCELELFPEDIDSTDIFKDGEIQLSFFPKFRDYKDYSVKKLGNNYCTTLVFDCNEIIRMGCDDFKEWNYDVKHSPDSVFYEIIESSKKDEISPWLLGEYKRRRKSEK